jgi:FdhD protein
VQSEPPPDHASPDPLGLAVPIEVTEFRTRRPAAAHQAVATEVPFTIMNGDLEIATMQCSPAHLRELVYGFLYAAGFIAGPQEVLRCDLDATRWLARVELAHAPDPELLGRRIFTPGCGKGVTYADLSESSARLPIRSNLRIAAEQIEALAGWLQRASAAYRETRGLHTAALSDRGALPELAIDDIGRHNAVDKVIGDGLLRGRSFAESLLVSSGRISSEILHKAKRCGIPVLVARGAPTHQSVLRARDMGLTIVGFARSSGFTVFSHPERIIPGEPAA